jgi:hypothetical protein
MRRRPLVVAFATLVIILGVAAITLGTVRGGLWPTAQWSGPAAATPAADPCGPWGCAQQARFAAAAALLATKAGHIGMVVRDRVTGAVWHGGDADRPLWTASTIKLALAVDLLERHRNRELTLDATARQQIADMLAFSSNSAATALWNRYKLAKDLQIFRDRFGMTGLAFAPGNNFWGNMKCTTGDLAALMSFVLDALNAEDRAYLIGAMRGVDPVQQWGVWSAGPSWQPGLKNGWSVEKDDDGKDHWVVLTVGFAGPQERYVVSVTHDLPPGTRSTLGNLDVGVQAVSDLVATIFGAPVPASPVIPNRL